MERCCMPVSVMQTCDFSMGCRQSSEECIRSSDPVYMFCVALLDGTILEAPPVQWMEGRRCLCRA